MQRVRKIMRRVQWLLPLLFIAYYSNITFFTHTHVVGGVTIVHSHPYAHSSSSSGAPSHEHTTAQLQLIAQLSQFYASGIGELQVLPLFYKLFETICTDDSGVSFVIASSFLASVQFRGPPCIG